MDLVLRSRRVVLPGGICAATVHIARGRITRVSGYDDVPDGLPFEDVENLAILPGLVDTHVHINEPGRTEWEGFVTATRAAAAGGVTTIIDMPLNSIPPTTTLRALEEKQRCAEGRLTVDVGFSGGVVPTNHAELAALFDAGACMFKCFLSDSGVPEFPHVGEADVANALRILADRGAPLLVHAELAEPLDAAAREVADAQDARRYATYLASRPPLAEHEAVRMVARLAREYGARAHIVHLSAAGALDLVRRAKDDGTALSVETCPHYLYFASERIEDGRTEFKCAPPIREEANRALLWSALSEGLIDQVVTDHSPSTPALKCSSSGDFMRAWGGISSLQLGLAVVWTEARAHGRTLGDIARWMSRAPAHLAGLAGTKGEIAPGCDADLVVLDDDAPFDVDAARLEHKHKLTPYAGQQLTGRVVATYLRGAKIFESGRFLNTSRGRCLRRSGA